MNLFKFNEYYEYNFPIYIKVVTLEKISYEIFHCGL